MSKFNCKIRECVPLFISKDFAEDFYYLHFKKHNKTNVESIVISQRMADEYIKKYVTTTRPLDKMRVWNIHSKK